MNYLVSPGMPYRFKLPGISPAVSQLLVHVVVIFLVAFGGQLTAGATGVISIPTLLALLSAAAAAGVTAVVHYVLGLIPSPPPPPLPSVPPVPGVLTASLQQVSNGVALKVSAPFYQFFISIVVVFLSIFGAQLATGAAGITSIPTAEAAISAAISAAVAAVVQYIAKLVPVPTAKGAL